MFESSDEEYIIDAQNDSSDEADGHRGRIYSNDNCIETYEGVPQGSGVLIGLENRGPSIRRVGSRQMLVFLTDGNSIGKNIFNIYANIKFDMIYKLLFS